MTSIPSSNDDETWSIERGVLDMSSDPSWTGCCSIGIKEGRVEGDRGVRIASSGWSYEGCSAHEFANVRTWPSVLRYGRYAAMAEYSCDLDGGSYVA